MVKAARQTRDPRRAARQPLKVRAVAATMPCQCGCEMEGVHRDTDQLLRLMNDAGILVLVINLEGRIVRFNHALEIATGVRQSEAESGDWFDLFVPENRREEMRASCLKGSRSDNASPHSVPLVCRDGRECLVEWFHSDLSNEQGERHGILCVGRDVTPLKNVRQALLASEERNRSVLETAVNAIVTISERGIMESVNSATERMFGYSSEEMIGKNVSLLMPSPYREQHDSYLERYKQTGERKIIGIGRETLARRKDGGVFPVDLSVGEVWLPSGRVFTGIIRDISDRKRLEQEMLQISEQEQQRIGQDIHDDLCQQLAAISCLVQAAQQRVKKTNAHDAESLAEVVKLVSHANTRAREMSRGLVPVVLESGGLMAALGELAASTQKVFRNSSRFECEPPVYVDENMISVQLYRIAQEAVGNAVKHSRASLIEISLARTEQGYKLIVSDNGVGIPDHSPLKGTGMGLLTMTHRAKMLGGRLSVITHKKNGTVVMCEVPARPLQIDSAEKS